MYILTQVDISGWLRGERGKLGLSTRDLARLAGVAYPTISRIENGHEQPRWDTLCRIAEAFGKSPTAIFEDLPVPRIAELEAHWSRTTDGEASPDWTRWRAFVDQLRLHTQFTAVAIAESPLPTGSALIDNLLAATAEKLADDMQISRPAWTGRFSPLREAWGAPGTPRRREAMAASTPSQFAARNITLPESAIWRARDLVLA